MTIETLFNIGDIVWYLNSNQKAVSAPLHSIQIDIKEDGDKVTLWFKQENGFESANEDHCYGSKHELIQSL